MMFRLLLIAGCLAAPAPAEPAGTVKPARPTNFQRVAQSLRAGDTMELEVGDYSTLRLDGLRGRPDAWITIRGLRGAAKPNLRADYRASRNTLEIRNSAYVAIEGLRFDGRNIADVFAVNATGTAHHIRIEDCTIVGHGGAQQTVAISTKTEGGAWAWTIRNNVIEGAGTGLYLGNSDGSCAFFGGLIEGNLFLGTHGYNMQIKHQNKRPAVEGVANGTIIRNNVFIKGTLPHADGARPNVLLGGFPEEGQGTEDMYHVYGNVFYGNTDEVQLQAEGRVSIHDNLFINCKHNAISLMRHRRAVKVVHIYHNTFYGVRGGIEFYAPATLDHQVVGNLFFGEWGIRGECKNKIGNVHDTVANAGLYVCTPSIEFGKMDFYPLAGKGVGSVLDLSAFKAQPDYGRDFNGVAKGDAKHRGAYAGAGGKNPGWKLARTVKEPNKTR